MLQRRLFLASSLFLALSTAACASSESAVGLSGDGDRDAASDGALDRQTPDGSDEAGLDGGAEATDREDAAGDGESVQADASDGAATDSGDTADGGGGCLELTVDGFGLSSGFALAKGYDATFSPNIGASTLPDFLTLQFFTEDSSGTYDLAAGDDANFSTCKRCLIVQEDVTDSKANRTYFQSGGSLVIDAKSDVRAGTIYAKLQDVTLVEVTFDPSTSTSAPVPNGACLHVTSAPVEVEWSCPLGKIGDKVCDCGCGARDPDCKDATAAACDSCSAQGSCNGANGCPGNVDPNDNAVCVP